MQDALAITAAARIETWSAPLARHLARLDQLRPRLLALQFGGAVGVLDRLGSKGRRVSARMAKDLGLGLPPRSWHTQRDGFAELASWLSMVSGSLGKLGQDVALMAQNPVSEIALLGGGGSSAMPHKQNPVRAEVLVALAHYASTLLPGMHQALIAEQERSGAAWTLEWLVLPQMVMATGVGLRTAIELAQSVQAMGVAYG
jgi:3-carboxy-cis,cis-muconate cycloisomerase